jgi:TetR/AcrR family transcriptional repressor of nem operon
MRYDKGHKATTRERIVDAAGQRFRIDGIDGAGVASLMEAAGLTAGGFYNHFESKDDLVREVVTTSLRAKRESMSEAVDTRRHGGLQALVDYYLSAAHRDNPEDGCTCAALTMEIARGSTSVRRGFTGELVETLAMIGALLPSALSSRRRRDIAQAVFASMIGTLALARAVDDVALSNQMLASGRAAAMLLAQG